jgi:hypothetical protein
MEMNSVPVFKKIVKRPHRIYNHGEIAPILDYLSKPPLPLGAISKISGDTGIPKQTLSDWKKERTKPGGENWFPLGEGRRDMRIFTYEQEEAIVGHLKASISALDMGQFVLI